MGYFGMTLNASIAYRVGFSLKGTQTPMGYFEMALHVGIAFKARSSLKRYPNRPNPHQMLARK